MVLVIATFFFLLTKIRLFFSSCYCYFSLAKPLTRHKDYFLRWWFEIKKIICLSIYDLLFLVNSTYLDFNAFYMVYTNFLILYLIVLTQVSMFSFQSPSDICIYLIVNIDNIIIGICFLRINSIFPKITKWFMYTKKWHQSHPKPILVKFFRGIFPPLSDYC